MSQVIGERSLQEAREAGLTLGIATTTTPENVEYLLSYTLGKASIDWFDVIAAGDIVPAKKPAPDIYTYAMEKLGVQADECLAFEDSENGLRSSVAAGLKTIVTVNSYTLDQDFGDALLVLEGFGDPDEPTHALKGEFSRDYLDIESVRGLFEKTG